MRLHDAIEIVKQAAYKCKGGHFGCNSNGEHEKCNGCGLTYCKSRNKIWFGALDDGTDTNVGSNGWIPCSGCADCNHKECEHYGKVLRPYWNEVWKTNCFRNVRKR